MKKYTLELELFDEQLMIIKCDGYRVTAERLLVVWDKINGKDANHSWYNLDEVFRLSVKEV